MNTEMKNNAALLTKGSFSILFEEMGSSKVEIKNIIFENCYSSNHGCIEAKTEDSSLNQVIEIDNITFTFTKPNWVTNYMEYYTVQGKIWADEFPQYITTIYPKCFGYSSDYFYFAEVPTKIINFIFSNTNLEVNSLCITNFPRYPNIVTYSKLNKGSFGKSDLVLQDINEILTDGTIKTLTAITDVPGTLSQSCSYNQIDAQSNIYIYIYI